tara:strand:+ start:133 stop:651 length:519 start_codon:yes stop_codon:yes gene_type:complete
MTQKKMTLEEFAAFLKTAEGKLHRETGKGLQELALIAINKAMKNFTTNDLPRVARTRNTEKSRTGGPRGSVYTKNIRTGNSGYMVGPRVITGNLRRSLTVKMSLDDKSDLRAHIFAGFGEAISYAAPLEFGAPKRNILPRLYLGRAVEEVENARASMGRLIKALDATLVRRA